MHDNLEAPIINWIKCQKFALMDSAIGSDIGAFSARFNNVKMLIKHNKLGEAIKELRNQEHLFWHCINEISPDLLAFAALVKEIDGEEIVIKTDEDVYKVAERLKDMGITKEVILNNEPKKKISNELKMALPDNGRGFELFTAYKRIAMIEYDEIIDGQDYSDRKDAQEKIIADYTRISSFDGVDAEHVRFENEFYNICAVLDTEINRPAKSLGIRDWYLQKKLYHEKYNNAA